MRENNHKIDLTVLLFDFLRVVRKMWRHFVVFAVVGALIAGFMANSSYVAKYTAYSSFTINIWDEESETGYSSYYDNEAADQLAETFPYILTSGVLQRKVASELGEEGLSGNISASVLENTNLFTLSVTDTDPQRAYDTLQVVIENYPSVSEAVVGKLNMTVLDESGVPTSPDSAKNIKNDAVKGGIIGFAIVFAWAVIVTLLRRTIRCEEDCEKHINQRCLGTVPFVRNKERSNKKKNHINISSSNVNPDYKESIRIIRNKLERYSKKNDVKRIVITSALAGEGKSTIAVNLAISLAQEGRKVALVDCDLRNPSDADIMGMEPKFGLVDFLDGKIEMKDCLSLIKYSNYSIDNAELYFVSGGKAVADGSNRLGNEKMKEIIEFLDGVAEYVILDSAPVGLLTDASVLAQYADGSIFVVKKDFAKAEHIMSGIEHLAGSNIPVIGCVLNGD